MELSGFSCDLEHGFYSNLSQVYWGNKQMLKFVLDFVAYVGTKEFNVRGIIHVVAVLWFTFQ
jgi:hypothetical protein